MANNSRKKSSPVVNTGTVDFDKKEKQKESMGYAARKRDPSRLIPLLIGALGVFMIFCLSSEKLGLNVGVVGAFFSDVLTGIFGGGAWFVPIFMIITAILWRRDASNEKLLPRTLFSVVCMLFISVLFYDFSSLARDIDSGAKEFGIPLLWTSGTEGVGGGLLGGLVGQALNLCIGIVGTIIVAILIIIIFVVFYLGIDIPALARSAASRIGSSLAENKERRAEERKEARRIAQEEAARRQSEREAAAELSRRAPKEERISSPAPTDDDFDDAIIDCGIAEDEKPRRSAELPEITYGPASGVTPKAKRAVTAFDFESDSDGFDSVEEDDSVVTPSEPVREVLKPVTPDTLPFDIGEPVREVKPERIQSNRERIIDSIEDEYLEDEVIVAPKSFSDFEKITSTEADELIRSAGGSTSVDEDDDIPFDVDPDEAPVPTAPVSKSEVVHEESSSHVLIRPDMIVDKSSVAKTARELGAIEPSESEATPEEKKPAPKSDFNYKFPPYSLLKTSSGVASPDMNAEIQANADKLIETLASFNVRARISSIARGPRITRYELVPDAGIRIRSIANLVDDISMNLASAGIRIEAPIPGKAAVGIEVPNKKSSTVNLRDLLDTDAYRSIPSKTCVCLGSDVAGDPVFCDIAKMPHMLIAGATGMGKSVCINVIITSILYKADPNEVKLILIDPKKVELGIYGGIPHLLVPVVNDPQKAAGALSWAVGEMERRFDIFEDIGVRDIKGYNKLNADGTREKLPSIIIIIDELHDLMMVSPDSVEKSIVRIAQKARAAGIHLILGTQRPSVDVITGVIKANVPSRIAFHVASQVDSRTILDMVGAEKLLNNGDMLYMAVSESKAKRVQGAFVDEDDVAAVTDFIKKQTDSNVYNEEIMKDIEREAEKCDSSNKKGSGDAAVSEGGEDLINDPKFRSAIELSIEFQKISTSLLQRKLGIGYGKAAKFIDQMHEMGIVSAPDGQKPRNVLITHDQYLEMIARNGD